MSIVAVSGKELDQEFEEIFREHHELVYRTAYSVTGTPEDAEDVLQTIFLRLLRSDVPPGLKQNPKAYLYRAAVNLSLNTVRSRRRRMLTGNPECLAAPRCQAESDEDTAKRLLDAIAHLNPRAVEILILRYEHNYSDADIAKLLGTSRGTIAVSLFRSRARIKKLMRISAGERK